MTGGEGRRRPVWYATSEARRLTRERKADVATGCFPARAGRNPDPDASRARQSRQPADGRGGHGGPGASARSIPQSAPASSPATAMSSASGATTRAPGRRPRAAWSLPRALIDMNHAMSRLGKPLSPRSTATPMRAGSPSSSPATWRSRPTTQRLGFPEAAKGLFPFLALAIVKDALPKKMLFDIVYNARLMSAEEACALHLVNEPCPGLRARARRRRRRRPLAATIRIS